jgi:hypothetical protein
MGDYYLFFSGWLPECAYFIDKERELQAAEPTQKIRETTPDPLILRGILIWP